MKKQQYTDLKEPKEKEDLEYFFLNSLLRSRIDVSKSSITNNDNFMNVYLSNLLSNLVSGNVSEFERKVTFGLPIEVFSCVENSIDSRFKFHVYKINGDHLLTMLGVFESYLDSKSKNKLLRQERIENTKSYYSLASGHLSRLPALHYKLQFSKSENIFDVLSNNLEDCVCCLEHMSRKYFNLYDIDPTNVFLQRQVQRGKLEFLRERYHKKWDEFFDADGKEKKEAIYLEILEIVATIREIDKTFEMDVKKENL